MIKRIMFDLDNTLIPWDDSNIKALIRTFNEDKIPFSEERAEEYFKAMKDYEKKHRRFDKVEMSQWIGMKLNLDLPDDFVKRWTDKLCYCVPPIDDKLISLLEYLGSKYSLCVVSNWFYNQQKARLKNYGILKYFDDIYTADKYDKKPYKEMYDLAGKGYQKDELAMVGDDYTIDIKSAVDYGMSAFYLNSKARYCNKKTKIIRTIYDLEKYL